MPNQILNLKNFDYFIGVDQNGSVYKGKPKPLAISIFDNKKKSFLKDLYLKRFNQKAFQEIIPNFNQSKVLIIVDAVLGLPKELDLDFDELLCMIKKESLYGLKPAQRFFYQLSTKPLLRESEKELKANSLFTPYPFQRNVQTGTFRILKDLSFDTKWYSIVPYDEPSTHLIVEGYPSLAFKKLGSPRRSKDFFKDYSQKKGFRFSENLSSDHIDAAMLIFQILTLDQIHYQLDSKAEGFILGYQTQSI